MLSVSTDEYPFAERWFEHAHGRLHYVDEGPRDGPALVCLHGNPTWSFFYRNLVKGLSSRFRVIALDHLGCGKSDKPTDGPYRLADHVDRLTDFMESLDVRRPSLAVHDWGGAIGMGFATEHPDAIDKLVVFNTAAFPSDRIPLSIDLCRIPFFGDVAIRGLNLFSRVALERCVVDRSRLTPAVRRGYLAPYDDWSARVAQLRFVQDIPMSKQHPSRARIERIGERLSRLAAHPLLLVWGGRDFCFDDSFYREWQRRFPRAVCRYLDRAGHYVLEDAHERVVPWVDDFLTPREPA
jgi:pimeloyl-ACP methyl ester carboxylesterase